jgi:hypothetical protein
MFQGLLQSLNLDQQLYIGGFRSRFGVTVESGVTTGLRGAIQRVSKESSQKYLVAQKV